MAMSRQLRRSWGEQNLGCNNLLAVVNCGFMIALGTITKQWGFWTNLKNALYKSQLLAICTILVEERVCFPELLFPSSEVKTKCSAWVSLAGQPAKKLRLI